MATEVIIYGVDPLLLETRRLLLSRHGFHAVVAQDPRQFESKLRELEPSLVVYCSSLAIEDLGLAIPLAQRLKPSIMKNLMIETLPYHADTARADMRVNGLQGPQAFLDAVEGLAH